VHRFKYLCILIDCKLTFRELINFITIKGTKLIFAVSSSAELNCGLNHTALKTI